MTSNTLLVLERPTQNLLALGGHLSSVLEKTRPYRNWTVKRFCYACGSEETRIKRRYDILYYDWLANIDRNIDVIHYLCAKCADHYIRRPKRKAYFDIKNLETHRKHSPMRMNYKGKILNLDHNPRIGVCNWCRAVVPFDCMRTGLHHEVYDDANPLKHTIELCNRCHNKTKDYSRGAE